MKSVPIENVLKAFQIMMSLLSPGEVDHSDDVTQFSVMLADAINMSTDQIEYLRIAATLHDVGKVGVAGFVLSKPGDLNAGEWAMMQEHPNYGAQIARALGFPPEVVAAILQHHENYDGSGYPNGLKGDGISLPARILRICDVYHALTHERAYHAKLSHEHALKVMEEYASNFDPLLLDKFCRLKLPEEKE